MDEEKVIQALRLAKEELSAIFVEKSREAFVHQQVAFKSTALLAVEEVLKEEGVK